MANYTNINELFTDICDSIRTKTGETGLINHTDIPEKIASIETGGGTGVNPQINADYSMCCYNINDSATIKNKLNEIVQHINQTNNFIVLNYSFLKAGSATDLDFDFSLLKDRVISAEEMFSESFWRTFSNLNKLDTSNITNMRNMFDTCKATSLDVSNFDTSKCTTMYGMFYDCSSLTSLDVSSFDTSKCTTMFYMFYGCRKLTSLDISNFDLRNCLQCSYMFQYCSVLAYLKFGENFLPQTATVNLFNSSAYQDIEIDMNGITNFSSFSSSSNNGNSTFNLANVWRGTDETKISRFISFANSLGIKSTEYNRTIKIYTDLYNVLSDEQKALITDKGYLLTYGTS